MLQGADVEVPGHRGLHDMLVLPDIDGCDAILGRSFLKKADASVHHRSGCVEFGRSPAVIVASGDERGTSGASVNLVKNDDRVPAQRVRDEAVISRAEETSVDCITTTTERASASEVLRSVMHRPEAEDIMSVLGDVPSVSGQDAMLRLFGLTAVPDKGDEETLAPLPQVSDWCQAELERATDGYEEVMEPLVGTLPPSRGEFDHQINEIDVNVEPQRRRAIPLNDCDQKALAVKLRALREAGLIRPSRSKWAAPVFMVPKADGDSRMVCDFRALNEVIHKDASSLPHIKELLNRVGKATVFTKLDLKSGYHQVRVRECDIPKTAFVTPHGHFEWLVMPFGETNAPATFSRLMSQLVLQDLIHDFVVVFQDDIMIASETEEDHVKHVQMVLERLQKHQLWIQPSKCAWGQREIEFLGFKVRATAAGTVISTMDSKIDAIREWPLPRTVSELRRFVGLCNFYRVFVRNHSAIAAPLTEMTAGGKRARTKLLWTKVALDAFDELKRSLCEAPVLAVADDERPFVLHVDACSFAVGAVLSQAGDDGALRPVAYFSQKLTDTQLRWATYERELWAVVAALQHWDWHLRGAKNVIDIHTDHRSLEALMAQETWSPKQSRWMLVLAQYKFEIKFIPGKLNVVADALSRRADHDEGSERRRQLQTDLARKALLASGSELVPSVSAVAVAASSTFVEELKAGYNCDEWCKQVLEDPEKLGYCERDGLLLRHGEFGVLVPDHANLRRRLIVESHDKPVGGHLGLDKTMKRIAEVYFWPGMRSEIGAFVASCPSCQRNKPLNARPAGLLKPLPIVPKGHTITMDFVGPLPKTARGFDSILVMCDKFSKRAWFEPVRTTITAKQTADVVMRRVVRDQLLPAAILTDRDTRFTSALWSELWAACGTELKLSTAFHSQSDGQTERLNRTVEEMLRSYVNERNTDWDQRLLMAEISYNSSVNAATGFTPMRLHVGIEGRSPIHLAIGSASEPKVGSANKMFRAMAEDAKVATEKLQEAQVRMKHYYDENHRHVEYRVGDSALIKAKDLFTNVGGRRKLRARYVGPYTVTEVMQDGLNVRLDLPSSMRHHPVFHVERLRKWVDGEENVDLIEAHERDEQWLLQEEAERKIKAPPASVVDDHLHGSDETSSSVPMAQHDDDGIWEYYNDMAFGLDPSWQDNADSDSNSESEVHEQVVSQAAPSPLQQPAQPVLRQSSRRRQVPDRFIHAGRLADHWDIRAGDVSIDGNASMSPDLSP
jgi:hypothetical protein